MSLEVQQIIIDAPVTLGGLSTETTETILAKLQGQEADPERIGAEYLPTTLEVDYFVTADREGLEIPAGAYGQKAGLPHFGNSPLSDVLNRTIEYFGLVWDAFDTKTKTLHLGSFPIPASKAISGSFFILNVGFNFTDPGSGSGIPHADDNLYLYLRLESGPVDLDQGCLLKLTPSALQEFKTGKLFVDLLESGGKLRPSMSAPYGSLIAYRSSTLGSASTVTHTDPVTIENLSTNTVDVGEETTLEFFLVSIIQEAASSIYLASGSIQLASPILALGELS